MRAVGSAWRQALGLEVSLAFQSHDDAIVNKRSVLYTEP